MENSSPRSARTVVVGGGTMGADVAVVLARGGAQVTVVDPHAARRDHLLPHIAQELAAAGQATHAGPVQVCASLQDVDWSGVVLVVECITEQLAAKQKLFAELETVAPPNAVLASNSSGFPISAIAQGLATAQRMLGLHFFMPAHLVPLVEVVLGERSNPALGTWLHAFMRGCGSVPVLVKKDKPCFLANRMQHALSREAFALIDEGIASPEDVDAAVRFGFGFRFLAAGPVLQRDHAGIEVHTAAAPGPGFACQRVAHHRASHRYVTDGHPNDHRSPRMSASPASPTIASQWVDPLIVTVAPNGAYKQPADHLAVPITPATLATTAKACLDAGAAMLHMHIRDAQGRHSLDVEGYREAQRVVRQAVGDAMVIQITSEAAGVYQAPAQIAMVEALQPEAVSIGLREVDKPEIGEAGLQRFFTGLAQRYTMVQVILYDVADLRRWQALRASGVVPDAPWLLLFVLGRYSAGQTSSPRDLLPFLNAHDGNEPWAVCAFVAAENACVAAAAVFGGHARVGFENNLLCKDGSVAPDNTALVRQAVEAAAALGRPLAKI